MQIITKIIIDIIVVYSHLSDIMQKKIKIKILIDLFYLYLQNKYVLI